MRLLACGVIFAVVASAQSASFKNAFAAGKLKQEGATVWLANSTTNKAAYQTAFRRLSAAGFNVLELAFGNNNLSQSLVYQVNPKPASAEYIKNIVPASEVTVSFTAAAAHLIVRR